jgi:hypothetical protein
MSCSPFSCGSICRRWPCAVSEQQLAVEEGMEAHSSLGDEGRREAECGMRLAASAEEVVPDQDVEDSRRLDAQGPSIYVSRRLCW